MTIRENDLLYGILEQISGNNNLNVLCDVLKVGLSDVFDILECNLLYFDSCSGKFFDGLNNLEGADDYFSTERLCVFERLIKLFVSGRTFVLNDDENIPEDVFDLGEYVSKTLSLPLAVDGEVIGLIRFKFAQKLCVTEDCVLFCKSFSTMLGLKLQNIILDKKLKTNLEFYKSIKNIAKIIETQYDYQYIIPLIGEMIDKFVLNHLIYIFLKQGDKFTLYWPNACWNRHVYELMDKLSTENSVVISDTKKTGVFGLESGDEIIGCIVAHSTIDKLSESEIEYLSELTSQSAVTIEKANMYSEMLKNATTDALTGLNNRRQFELRLKEQFAIANRQETPLCAIMTDIDFFKKFNDSYGHSVGDAVLKSTAEVIKAELREYDIPSRYGGEEFCILLPNTAVNEAKVVAERLRRAVKESVLEVKSEKTQRIENIGVTISIGLAQLEADDLPEDLYMKADKALYDAKESGRNKVVVYEK